MKVFVRFAGVQNGAVSADVDNSDDPIRNGVFSECADVVRMESANLLENGSKPPRMEKLQQTFLSN